MTDSNYYDTLDVSPCATGAEIKQAYRRLVKLFHPDSHCETANHEQIVRINAAYEVLGDPHQRRSYDQQLQQRSRQEQYVAKQHQQRSPYQTTYQRTSYRQPSANNAQKRSYGYRHFQDADEQLQQWLSQVYVPVNRLLCRILNPLAEQLDQLSADPFDDELMEAFQAYLQDCRNYLKQAQLVFRSLPNPANVAGAAVHLYYCLNQVADGIEELEMFTLNYDDGYLHTGQELFRIATGLHCEAQYAVKDIG
ncbi:MULTISPECIES: J domain-containing protein [Cyanophyceae]|uniref:J domain-containing protein n=1 Tax=Cyanophyceae TaxID=3028117 RepID=UPI001685265E|nr:DnaJ domain-containing protein [Trichocoleus sp. FACHB-40]MBD2005015.1 J domain-containing protein [Trichocoleus sp. FACHB-40]